MNRARAAAVKEGPMKRTTSRLSLLDPRAPRAFLDAVTSRRALVSTTDEGYYPLQIPSAHVRAGPTVNALGFHGECAGVPGEVLQGHRPPARTVGPEENALFGELMRASPRCESTWKFWPDQQKPSNKWCRRNVFPGMDLGRVMGGFVGHLDGRFRGLPGTRCSA